MDLDSTPSGLDPVEPLAEKYLRRRRRGEPPTLAECAARYPELAERIVDLFPALEVLEGLKPTLEEVEPRSEDLDFRSAASAEEIPLGQLGDLTLIRELGRGGMGIVYEAEHESLKSRMALKVMHPRFRADRAYVRRFQTEARSAAKRHHTNIVPVFDYGEQDGVCYSAMQRIEGVGLERILEDDRLLRSTGNQEADPGARAEPTMIDINAKPISTISRGLRTGQFEKIPTETTKHLGSPFAARLETDGSSIVATAGRSVPRSPVNPSRSISAKSRGSGPRSPMRLSMLIKRV